MDSGRQSPSPSRSGVKKHRFDCTWCKGGEEGHRLTWCLKNTDPYLSLGFEFTKKILAPNKDEFDSSRRSEQGSGSGRGSTPCSGIDPRGRSPQTKLWGEGRERAFTQGKKAAGAGLQTGQGASLGTGPLA